MKKLRLLIIALTCLATLAAQAETVKIAAEDDWAPFSSLKADKSGPEGFAVDIVRAAFNNQGIEVEFLAAPFTRCLYYTEIGTAVGCFDATIIESNKDTYYWHPTPLFYEELAIFAHQSATVHDLTTKDLEGKSVGYTIGYTYPSALMQNNKITKFGAKSDDQLILMLAAQRIDYILLNSVAGIYKINKLPKAKGSVKKVGTLSNDGFWVAFSKTHPEGKRLVALFEKGLQALKSTGQYAKMEADFRKNIGL